MTIFVEGHFVRACWTSDALINKCQHKSPPMLQQKVLSLRQEGYAHSLTACITAPRQEPRHISGIRHALDGNIAAADGAPQRGKKRRPHQDAHVAGLGGSAGEDDGDGLAGAGQVVG